MQQTIFNHDLRDCTRENELDKLIGGCRYSGRSLSLTYPGDIIQLHSDLQGSWEAITAHYKRIGLPYTDNVIWDDSFSILEEYPDHEPSFFFFGDRAHEIRQDRRWYEITRELNSKNNFIKLCKRLGVPTPKTFCFKDKSEFDEKQELNFPVYFKVSTSVSGLGVEKCDNLDELRGVINRLEEKVPFQIQLDIQAKTFLNIQYYSNGACHRVVCSEQIINGCAHAGNKYPTDYSPWEYADRIAEYINCNGMKGYFAFDFGVTQNNEFVAIECNPRFNGATYPTTVAMKLKIPEWSSRRFETSKKSFDHLNLTDVEYNPHTKVGAIIVNWGFIEEGKLDIMLAGSLDEQEKIKQKLIDIL